MACTTKNPPGLRERKRGPDDFIKRSLRINPASMVVIIASLDVGASQSHTYGDIVADESWSHLPLRIVPGHMDCHAILDVGVVPNDNIVYVSCAGQHGISASQ